MQIRIKKRLLMWLMVLSTLMVTTALMAQSGGNYEITHSLIGSGGVSAGTGFILNGAIGQKAITQSSANEYQLSAGFYRENRDLIFFNEFESSN